MGNSRTDIHLTYTVAISAPGRYNQPWWQVGNAGNPAQVAASLTELAARLDRDLHYPARRDRRLRSWFECELYGPGGVLLDCPQGAAPTHHLPSVLRGLALTVAAIPVQGLPLGHGTGD
ncbi:hypothetical protein [Nocardia goodfellowii]|uniref:Uncharacterized protein n=1 Tax=Nocardia goodfellowii TaxID=882446 RepID=A0ABS4QT06_9NOCA|nr:hypothetical protein [Nocardia goodfellowii]MBP2194213.1 hypothetical protein [Nocardia goodfellowii]